MTGRIFLRGKIWWMAYYLRGKEYRESTRTSDRKLAEKFLKRRRHEVGADKEGIQQFVGPQQQRITVNQLLDKLELDYRSRDKWDPRVAATFKPLRKAFGTIRAVNITSDAVDAYIKAQREDGYAKATINRSTQMLQQSFKLALRDKQLSHVPFIQRLSEIGNERDGFFERDDFEAVVKHLPEYLRDFTQFASVTGWRKSSISSLRWSDVGDDVIYLRALNSKSRKPGSLPMWDEVANIIARRRALRVFQSSTGEAMFAEYVFHRTGLPIMNIRMAWKTACRKAGVPGKLFHDLRRTASRNMIAAGVPQAVVMSITGHRTDSMFRRYAIVDENQKREALTKTAEYLNATSTKPKVVVIGKAAGK